MNDVLITVIYFAALAAAFRTLTEAGENGNAALTKLDNELQILRRDHPEWFDPQTGYLLD